MTSGSTLTHLLHLYTNEIGEVASPAWTLFENMNWPLSHLVRLSALIMLHVVWEMGSLSSRPYGSYEAVVRSSVAGWVGDMNNLRRRTRSIWYDAHCETSSNLALFGKVARTKHGAPRTTGMS